MASDITTATSGDQYVIQSDAGTLTIQGNINNALATTRTLSLQGAANGEVQGAINNTGTGILNVAKSGAGTWTLSSALNTYNGSTTVNGGTLSLGATGTIASSPTIAVNASSFFDVSAVPGGWTLGATGVQALSGTGTVAGSVASGVINGINGIIAPGTDGTVGTLNIQNKLALGNAATSIVKFDLANNNLPANNDLLAVNGGLTNPGGSTFAFSMLNNQLATARYKLITYTGAAPPVAGISLTGLGSGTTRQTFQLKNDIAGEIDLQVTGDPATLKWLGIAGNTWDRTAVNWYKKLALARGQRQVL